MTARSVVLVSRFDEAFHAHASQRLRALERLGHLVTPIEVAGRSGVRSLFRLGGWQRRLEVAVRSGTDLVLVLGVPELTPARVASLKAEGGGRWVNWFPDDLRTVDQVCEVAPAYDQVVVGGTDVAGELRTRVGVEATVLPPACDPSVYRPEAKRTKQYRANVVFAGRATQRRELFLAQLVEFGLALWGQGWRETALRDYCRGEITRTREFVRAYAGATVAVNIHHHAGGSSTATEPEASCNQRLFEIAAIGVPQVVDRRTDLPRWFTPGKEIVPFDGPEGLRRAVEAMLHDPPAATRIGEASRRRVLGEHTYMHRLQALLTFDA